MKPLDRGKVLVAHEEGQVLEKLQTSLSSNGFAVVTAADGIEAMVTATKELPALCLLSVSLPKIYGFEVCKRLKNRPETKEIKVILIASIHDQNKYRRKPETLHDADDYLEAHEINDGLMEKVSRALGIPPKGPVPLQQEKEKPVPAPAQPLRPAEKSVTIEVSKPGISKVAAESSEAVEKARRLARTIMADIYLYSKAKVDEAIKTNTFQSTFQAELREGKKLYDNRIPAEVKNMGDFFTEAINTFIEKRKKEME